MRRLLIIPIAAALLSVAGLSTVQATDAPGNNGTVKIHDGATEHSPITENDPHVCTFHLHFLFADAAQAGTWWIQTWPPTGDGSTVLSGTYQTDANGQDRQPEAGAYDLPDGHYKLFWQGRASTELKQKVFWVSCTVSARPSGTLSAQISAQQGELSVIAQLTTTLRAELTAETSVLASLSANARASLTARIAAQRAELEALATLSAQIEAQIAAERAELSATTSVEVTEAIKAEIAAERAELAAFISFEAGLRAELVAERQLVAETVSAQLKTALEARITEQQDQLAAVLKLEAALRAEIAAAQAELRAHTSVQIHTAAEARIAAEQAELAAIAELETGIRAELAAEQAEAGVMGMTSTRPLGVGAPGRTGSGATGGVSAAAGGSGTTSLPNTAFSPSSSPAPVVWLPFGALIVLLLLAVARALRPVD